MKKKILIIALLCLCIVLQACKAAMDKEKLPYPMGTSSSDGIYPTEEPGDSWDMETMPEPGETYNSIEYNKFISTEEADTQAFSLKVDTAAYTNISRFISNGQLPPKDAIRTEELINYFTYDEPVKMSDEHPFSVYTKVDASPFSDGKYMAFIRIKTPDIDRSDLPPSNLTFLIDTSGSMLSYDKLPLIQQAFSLLTENLSENDTVSIVTYAGSSEILLDSAKGSDKETILRAIQSLEAGGSTAGAQGIQTAYELAEKNYIEGANNRVILATDGDFNVGISNTKDLGDFISGKRQHGIYLSILGFGTGNLRDDMMETLSEKGNGNYSYIDTLMTAQKVLIDEMGANLFVVAKDVKAQLQFNKEVVKEFRLIGYENRQMSAEEFNDYYKDAGEIGAGTDVAVLVEFVLQDKYPNGSISDETMNVCIRYKTVDTEDQMEVNVPLSGVNDTYSTDFNFACAVAGFAELLRESGYMEGATIQKLISMAEQNKGEDVKGYRAQFIEMMRAYAGILD